MNKLALLSLTLAACTHDLAEFDRIDEVETGGNLDILYVYDSSGDHANYDGVAAQLDVLTAQIASIDGQVPSLHVGVVTGDLGTQGTEDELAPPTFRNCAGSGDGGKLTAFDAQISNTYLKDLRGADGARERNFDGDLEPQLALLTNPGPRKFGCEVQQPMEAMRRALDPATNPGFLRDDARLMVVFLTNDDDCSLKNGSLIGATKANGALCASEGVVCDDGDPSTPGTHANCRPRGTSDFVVPVADYKKFLTDLKGDKVTVSAVAGPNDPYSVIQGGLILDACSGAAGGHKPATRINSLVSEFGGESVNGCTLDTPYELITQPLLAASASCFPALRASDGDNCRVIENADGVKSELQPCSAGGDGACYELYTDADACPSGENVGISIDRRTSTAPVRSKIQATCFAAD
jgi:hypothetical protein